MSPATPAVTWPAPASIVQGTALSAAQLDASANVPGTFTYSPAAGFAPGTGTTALQATFTPTDATDYSTVTASVSLNVTKVAQTTPTITWPSPAAIPYGTALSAAQLNAQASVPGTFTYSPAAGTVPGAGTTVLQATFTPSNSTEYTSATATTSLVINKANPQITWLVPAAITAGTALSSSQLDAAASVPGTFTYAPSAGTVPATGTQTLQVTFTPNDATDYTTQTASVPLTVNAEAAGPVAILSPAAGASVSGTISVVGQVQVNLDAAGSHLLVDGVAYGSNVFGPFVYSLNTTNLSNGPHTLQIWAHDTGNTTHISPAVSVTVANGVTTTPPTITWPAPARIAYGMALSSAQLDASSSVAGTFSYTPAAGTVLAAGSHTLQVTFNPTNTTAYSVATASTLIQVSQLAPQLTWPAPAPIPSGTALSAAQLNATANVPGTFTYSPAAGSVPAAGTMTLQVTFTPADSTNYSSASATVLLTVTKAAQTTPTVTWPAPAGIVYGTALSAAQLNATASVPGVFAYSPAAGAVLSAGTQTLTVTFTPTNTTNYTPASATAILEIAQATPQITWPAPTAITAGLALTSAQLDAAASIPGSFSYSPSAGTVLGAGATTLTAIFTPTDNTDYSTQRASVTLTVNPASAVPTGPLAILSPAAGATVSGTITVAGLCALNLDAAGTHLLVDGAPVNGQTVFNPFLYTLTTGSLSNGPHTLQIWGHDIGNNTVLSPPLTIVIAN